MLEVRNWEVFGLQRSILASKNPMSMGEICTIEHEGYDADYFDAHFKKDIARGCNLGSAPVGSGHDNFLSGISDILPIHHASIDLYGIYKGF